MEWKCRDLRARTRRTFDIINYICVNSIFEQSQMFFEQRLLYRSKITERKNILKMNKEVGMLLPKKELIQVE